MHSPHIQPETLPAVPAGLQRITYRSAVDNRTDWALFLPGNPCKNTVVFLHGSFAAGDQIFTRRDLREFWMRRIVDGGHPLLGQPGDQTP